MTSYRGFSVRWSTVIECLVANSGHRAGAPHDTLEGSAV